MTGFADRIRLLCSERGMTLKDLERELGIANGYIANTQKRNSSPSIKRIDMIANYFGVSRDFIMGMENPAEQQPSTGVLIPILGRVAAGIPITAVENIIGQEEISKQLAATGEFFALRVKGDSMSPNIQDGDIVIVRKEDDAETGDIVIAIIDGQDGCCKRLKKLDNGIMLISINPAYEPMVFTHAEIDTVPVQIVGRVVELRRSM